MTNVYFKGMDGDEEYRRIKAKVERLEPLAEVDLLKLIFLPLMKSQQTEAEMAVQAAELAKASQSKYMNFAIAAIVAITDRFLPEEYKKRLLEVLRMTQIEQWLREEGREEGLKEGLKEGEMKGKLETARKALLKGISPQDAADITGLPLEKIIEIKRELAKASC
ncbi:Hypothetical protein DEACI_1989 [Acididesulfobacillus acetoxydans]|uniref:Rpn family recombination-promoting nuclease/putative transposase n=1 Tax=Acididesulfobacillus acetoxydans TaxID=1561005 RepID=A0A8S0VWX0_9FIRM|nr:Hypothetical protein DEACI_1989 [Acididesulfobacillus acetoxydans]CEJ07472.1 Hypothetical protein DEACI_1938 [Acididesulfobacillus acetoxydans]